MFEMENWEGLPVSTQYAEFRMRNEPLVEVTQVKGTSETHPILSPDDEWADFEIMWQRVGNSAYSRPFGGYVRQAYLDGLGMEEEGRGNPYKFGMVGASDTHTGAISDDESNFTAKVGILDGTAVSRGSVPISDEQVEALTGGNAIRQLAFKKIGERNFNNAIFNTWGLPVWRLYGQKKILEIQSLKLLEEKKLMQLREVESNLGFLLGMTLTSLFIRRQFN